MTKLIKKLLEVKNLLIIGIIYSVLITIAFLSSTNGLPKIDLNLPIDKVIHLIIYILLIVIWLLYFYIKQDNQLSVRDVFVIFIAILVYGIVIEILQEQLTTTRQADYLDVIANLTGAIIGLMIFLNVKNRIKT